MQVRWPQCHKSPLKLVRLHQHSQLQPSYCCHCSQKDVCKSLMWDHLPRQHLAYSTILGLSRWGGMSLGKPTPRNPGRHALPLTMLIRAGDPQWYTSRTVWRKARLLWFHSNDLASARCMPARNVQSANQCSLSDRTKPCQ